MNTDLLRDVAEGRKTASVIFLKSDGSYTLKAFEKFTVPVLG